MSKYLLPMLFALSCSLSAAESDNSRTFKIFEDKDAKAWKIAVSDRNTDTTVFVDGKVVVGKSWSVVDSSTNRPERFSDSLLIAAWKKQCSDKNSIEVSRETKILSYGGSLFRPIVKTRERIESIVFAGTGWQTFFDNIPENISPEKNVRNGILASFLAIIILFVSLRIEHKNTRVTVWVASSLLAYAALFLCSNNFNFYFKDSTLIGASIVFCFISAISGHIALRGKFGYRFFWVICISAYFIPAASIYPILGKAALVQALAISALCALSGFLISLIPAVRKFNIEVSVDHRSV